jgi:hypothetical protein
LWFGWNESSVSFCVLKLPANFWMLKIARKMSFFSNFDSRSKNKHFQDYKFQNFLKFSDTKEKSKHWKSESRTYKKNWSWFVANRQPKPSQSPPIKEKQKRSLTSGNYLIALENVLFNKVSTQIFTTTKKIQKIFHTNFY